VKYKDFETNLFNISVHPEDTHFYAGSAVIEHKKKDFTDFDEKDIEEVRKIVFHLIDAIKRNYFHGNPISYNLVIKNYFYENFRFKYSSKRPKKGYPKIDKCIFCEYFNFEKPGIYHRDGIDYYILEIDEDFALIINAFPYLDGNVMLIPRNHVEDILELDEKTFSKIIFKVQDVIKKLLSIYNSDKYVVWINVGKNSGRSIEHLHIQMGVIKNENSFNDVDSADEIYEKYTSNNKKLKNKRLKKSKVFIYPRYRNFGGMELSGILSINETSNETKKKLELEKLREL